MHTQAGGQGANGLLRYKAETAGNCNRSATDATELVDGTGGNAGLDTDTANVVTESPSTASAAAG